MLMGPFGAPAGALTSVQVSSWPACDNLAFGTMLALTGAVSTAKPYPFQCRRLSGAWVAWIVDATNNTGPEQADASRGEEDNDMTARLFMDPAPTVLRDTDTIGAAAEQIMAHRYRSLPVVDGQGRYLGIVGVNGMLRLVLPKAAVMDKGLTNLPYISTTLDRLRSKLRDVVDQPVTLCLETDVPTVEPDMPILETLLTLYRTKTALAVVEKETRRLAGVISYFDVGRKVMAQGPEESAGG